MTSLAPAVPRTAPAALRSQRASRVNHQIAILIACLGTGLLGLRLNVLNGVSVGLVVCVLATPLWLGSVRLYRGATALLLGGLLTVVCGLLLIGLNPFGHTFSPANAVTAIGYLGTFTVGAAFLLWARRLVSEGALLVWFGFGLLLSINTHYFQFASNPWKFGFSVPLTVLALGLVQMRFGRFASLAVLIMSAGLLVVSDARSGLAIVVVTGFLVAYQARPKISKRAGSAAVFVALAAAAAFVIYRVAEVLILSGALGARTQARTAAQIASAGSLLLGGRPELGASTALLMWHPLGFGPGVRPTLGDLRTAQAGMNTLGYNSDNGYVYHYMFGVTIELHSTAADLWAWFGLAGLAFAALITFTLIRGVAVATVGSVAGAGMLYLVVESAWNMAFSPIGSSYIVLAAALGLAIPLRRASTSQPPTVVAAAR